MATIKGTNVVLDYFNMVLGNLYTDSTLIPGVTYNPKTIIKAGGTYIPKFAKGSAVAPKLPGQKYDLSGAQDSLIPIMANNSITPGYELYEAQMAATNYDMKNAALTELTKGKITPSFNVQGMACLVKEGTDLGDTSPINKGNVRERLLELRKEMRDKGAQGNVLIVNTDVYTQILSEAGKDFDNELKNRLNLTANIGQWLGWTIVESNVFSMFTEGKYIDYAGIEQTVDFTKVDLIAYDYRVFYIETLINMLKFQDAQTFNGVELVSEIINGFRVADPEQVLVKFNA